MRLEFVVLALSVLVGPVAAVLGAEASGRGPWVVVVPPWRSAEQVAERAGARLIGPTQAPFGFLVAAQDEGAARALAAAGAWAVVDAETIANLCGVN